ncbi:MAG: hypothetical protein EXS48_01860 [Candidatus Staskawiczbacteria bacterium]|nr:hypothetical protein [Candidatus Staskawiczbacteria bacterium]
MASRERLVVRKNQVIALGQGEEDRWIALFKTIHHYLAEGWDILHVDQEGDDLVVSLARPGIS